jgi:hypothetical protein
MSESGRRLNQRQRFLAENPDCYFCDGQNPATTADHVPPRACFPDGYAPEGFEFPACKACNEGAVKQDQIFGLYALLLDFDESKLQRPEYLAKLNKLRQGVRNNYPDALPDEDTATPVYGVNSLYSPSPVAISVQTPPALKEAAVVMGKKLTHALYLRESGNRLTAAHSFLSSVYQPQQGGTETLTTYFASLLPNQTVGERSNIKDYGDQFRYISGFKPEQDFFVYAAQFGHGAILWGIVRGPHVPLPDGEPMRSAPWIRGACGAGAHAVTT